MKIWTLMTSESANRTPGQDAFADSPIPHAGERFLSAESAFSAFISVLFTAQGVLFRWAGKARKDGVASPVGSAEISVGTFRRDVAD